MRIPSKLFGPLLALLLALPGAGAAQDLRIEGLGQVRVLTAAQMRARPDARDILVPDDPVYHRDMHYRAVPLRSLLSGLAADAHVQFVATDGFTGEVPAHLVIDGGRTTGWLAIEPEGHPWPPVGPGKPSAGPFYVVWTEPSAAGVGREQWPFQVATVRVTTDVDTRFPGMLPDPALPPDAPARRGFAVFKKDCITCHTLNGQGDARLGPDLNIPHSPTEYLGTAYLKKLVRNPQDLRHWPEAKMPAFDRRTLSDADLDDLVAYLSHMASRRPK
ncbi:cytochrome c [Pinirhizobacter sp.]|jgi:mono/diheme cytochrome c family protein|uniref:cytochrome c n=1 Tax=Pinirhizobacter sp. TaxID=2950432 RepID=UPI002F40E480